MHVYVSFSPVSTAACCSPSSVPAPANFARVCVHYRQGDRPSVGKLHLPNRSSYGPEKYVQRRLRGHRNIKSSIIIDSPATERTVFFRPFHGAHHAKLLQSVDFSQLVPKPQLFGVLRLAIFKRYSLECYRVAPRSGIPPERR